MTPSNDNPSQKPKKWMESQKWQNIQRISLEDCIKCTGQIARGNLKNPNKHDDDIGEVFTFGKYKSRRYDEIEEEDPGYINWCR